MDNSPHGGTDMPATQARQGSTQESFDRSWGSLLLTVVAIAVARVHVADPSITRPAYTVARFGRNAADGHDQPVRQNWD